MPLAEHLTELRNRLVLAAAGVAVGAIVGWFFYDPVLAALRHPLEVVSAQRGTVAELNFATVAAPFDIKLKVAFFLGVVLSSPWWLYQLWAFITPGLTRKERRYAVGYVACAVPLFAAGLYGSWLLLPHAVQILAGFAPSGTYNLIDAQAYLSFVMRLMLAFGITGVVPVLMIGLNMAGVVSARKLLKGWRWAVLAAFVFAAIATPTPDALTMILVALPICVLYFGALGICALHDRRAAKRLAKESI